MALSVPDPDALRRGQDLIDRLARDHPELYRRFEDNVRADGILGDLLMEIVCTTPDFVLGAATLEEKRRRNAIYSDVASVISIARYLVRVRFGMRVI